MLMGRISTSSCVSAAVPAQQTLLPSVVVSCIWQRPSWCSPLLLIWPLPRPPHPCTLPKNADPWGGSHQPETACHLELPSISRSFRGPSSSSPLSTETFTAESHCVYKSLPAWSCPEVRASQTLPSTPLCTAL